MTTIISKPQIFQGVVVKAAMKDTATVRVDRYVKHPKYKKYQVRSKKFLVHDPGNTVNVGDKVTIVACRPISKMKRFAIANASPAGSAHSAASVSTTSSDSRPTK